jgi:hypothetical protein
MPVNDIVKNASLMLAMLGQLVIFYPKKEASGARHAVPAILNPCFPIRQTFGFQIFNNFEHRELCKFVANIARLRLQPSNSQ